MVIKYDKIISKNFDKTSANRFGKGLVKNIKEKSEKKDKIGNSKRY